MKCRTLLIAGGIVVAGVGIGTAELVAGEYIEPLAALKLETATRGKGEAVERVGFVIDFAVFLIASHGPTCFAAHVEESGFTQPDIQRVAGGHGHEE